MGSIIAGAVSAGISIYQVIQAGIDKKRAREEWENYTPEEITNPYAGLDRVPMEAYNLRHDANATSLATGASIAQQSGRGLSIVPQITNQYAQSERELYGEVEKYQAKRDLYLAAGESEKQKLELDRERQYLEGLSGFENAANQNLNSGLVSLGSSAVSLAGEIGSFNSGQPVDNKSANTNLGGGYNPYSESNIWNVDKGFDPNSMNNPYGGWT